MNTNYTLMPDSSRVWVYQSSRKFTDSELEQLTLYTTEFTNGWNAHGAALASTIAVFYNQFIVLCVNEQVEHVSGCAIDKSTGFMKQIEQKFGVQLFDRMAVAYKVVDEIKVCSMSQFQDLINEGKVNENTIVFNNLVSTKKELESNWQVPLSQSWHLRMVEMV